MAGGNNEFKQDVEKAVLAGSDMSQGSLEAYKKLQQELAADREKYQTSPETFNQLGKEVVNGLKYNGVIDTQLEYFAHDNVALFDATENSKVDRNEMNPANNQGLNGFQVGMLEHFQATYGDIQRRAPREDGNALKTEFAREDFQTMIETRNRQGITQAAKDIVVKPQYGQSQTDQSKPQLNQEVPVIPPTETQRKQHPEKISQEHAPDYKAPARPHQELAQPQPLKLPELKAGDDIAKAREAYAKEVEKAVYGESHYSVQRGQGWDRVARDVLRHQGDGSHTNERNVVNLSDNIARLNGWEGRLDPNKMLHPDNSVQIRDNAWIKARTEAQMKQFDEAAAKLKAATPVENKPEPPNQQQNSGKDQIQSVIPKPKEQTSQDGQQDNIEPPPPAKTKTEVIPPDNTDKKPVIEAKPTPDVNLFDGDRNGEGIVNGNGTDTAKAPESTSINLFGEDYNQALATTGKTTDGTAQQAELVAKQEAEKNKQQAELLAKQETEKRQQAEALVKREVAEREKLAQANQTALDNNKTQQVAETPAQKNQKPDFNNLSPDSL
jgi:hypothetical protein